MIFSLLTSDEKKAMIGDVLSSLLSFANSLFGKQFLPWSNISRKRLCKGSKCALILLILSA